MGYQLRFEYEDMEPRVRRSVPRRLRLPAGPPSRGDRSGTGFLTESVEGSTRTRPRE